MTSVVKLTIAFTIGLFSCTNNDTATNNSKQPVTSDTAEKAETETPKANISKLKRFAVDDYPLTDDMFGTGVNGREIKSGDIVSLDKVWFTNDTLKQTIAIELATDDFRMGEFHFQNMDIPKGLIKRMELYTDDGNPASQQSKDKNFKGFTNTSTKISKRYFVTEKGFKLGDSKQNALKIYGMPDNTTTEDNIEILEWDFVGDILYDGKSDLKGKPLAKDNYGHQTTMFFRNDTLIAIIFHNDIP